MTLNVARSEKVLAALAGFALLGGFLVMPALRNADPTYAVTVAYAAGDSTDPWGTAWGIPEMCGATPGSLGPDVLDSKDDIELRDLDFQQLGSPEVQLLSNYVELSVAWRCCWCGSCSRGAP